MELLAQRLEQRSERVALWRVHERRTEGEGSCVLSHGDSAVGITFAALFQWINAVRDALLREPSSPVSSSPSSSSPQLFIVGIALPPCSVEESALVLAVAREKRWAYVPIDVTLPLSHQVLMLQDARVNTLVTLPEAAIAQFLTENAGDFLQGLRYEVESDGVFRSLSVFPLTPPPQTWIFGADPLYILYTSGSTGKPKGVVGTRIGALNRMQWMWEQFPFNDHSSDTRGEEERVVRVTKLTFVDSVWEILGTLLKQVPLVHLSKQTLPPNEQQSSTIRSGAFPAAHAILDQGEVFLQAVERFQVSRFTVVPSVLEVLLLKHSSDVTMLQKAVAKVQYILVSGEVLPLSLLIQVTRVLPHAKLLNLYGEVWRILAQCLMWWYSFAHMFYASSSVIGSTEVSGDITWLEIHAPLSEKDVALWTKHGVPIGRVQNRIGNTRLRISRSTVEGSSEEYAQRQPATSKPAELSSNKQTLEGELYVAGDALALGYTCDDTPVNGDDGAVKKWISIKEDTEKPTTWFRMGDICKVVDDLIFFCGRSDSLVKIRGQRIQLGAVERIIETGLSETMESTQRAEILPVVVLAMKDPSAYGLSSQSLVAFLISQTGGEKPREPLKSQTSSSSAPMLVVYPRKASLFKWIRDKFGHAYVPHEVVTVPVNSVKRLSSGKLDKSELRVLYETEIQTAREMDQRRDNTVSQDEKLGPSVSIVRRFLKAQVSKVLGITSCADRTSNASMMNRTFQEVGGNSLHATLLSWEVQQELGCVVQPQGLLSSTLGAIAESLERQLAHRSDSSHRESVMLAQSESDSSVRLDAAAITVHDATARATKRPRRAVQQNHPEADTLRSKTNLWGLSRLNRPPSGSTFVPTLASRSTDPKTLSLELQWKFDLSKCIDASPLVIRHGEGTNTSSTWVAIGSHSAEFACLDVKNNGNIIWKRKLDDRIEASASVSECNLLVYVGTYSGALYAMDVLSGEVKWLFRAKDAIKAAVLVIDALQLVVCGAYDHFLYGIDSISGEKQWELGTAGGGSVFSTPVFASATSRLFFACTKGSVCCVALRGGGDADEAAAANPEVCWTRQLPAPVFSSLNIAPELSLLFVGCADGNMYALDTVDGEIRWQVETRKPIFSSPCVYTDSRRSTNTKSSAVFGSHDGVLRKVSCEDGRLAWATSLGNPVFSSPAVFGVAGASPVQRDNRGLGEPEERMMCCVATIDGTLFVCDESTGAIATQLSSLKTKEPKSSLADSSDTEELQALGELFSSPVVIGDFCLIGSRSNQLYAFRVATA